MRKAILVVDNDLAVIEDVCKTLNELGYDTFSANSAKEGFEILTKQHVDLVLADVLLEGPPATHLHHLIKQSQALRGMRFIYMTAYAPTSVSDQIPRIQKPFATDKLQEVLNETFMLPPPSYDDDIVL